MNDIERQFDALFGFHFDGRRPRRYGGRGCLTHELADLCRNLSQNWDDLDEAFRQRVLQILVVDDTQTPVRVALL